MGKRALALGATTFAYFTRNPRGGAAKAADPEDAASLRKIMAENGFGRLVAHAPYTLNLCSAKPDVRSFARRALAEDLQTMELIPGNYYNFHPGSHVGQGADEGIRLIAEGLNEALEPGQSTCVLLETMAGKGTDAGYDVSASLDGVLQEFDRVIGLSRLKALHLNDSKNPVGAHKDRHERLGLGHLGLGCFSAIVRDERTRDLPMILETPNEAAGYAAEIAALRALADGADTEETMARLAHERDE